MAGLVERLDAQLESLFRGWNWLTTILAILLACYLLYPVIAAKDPDTHPLLLSRQANASAVRQPGESAVYRSNEVPHGLPLKTGLDVKEPGAPRFSPGKDGDLRDIWRRAVQGTPTDRDAPGGETGKIFSVHGKDSIDEHQMSDASKELNIIGGYMKQRGATCVGIYLPNSVELLIALFACAFYGMHPVLIPYDKPKDVVMKLVKLAEIDYVIAAAGSLPLEDLSNQCEKVLELTWVVEKTSRDVDWKDQGSNTHPTSTWHELVEDQKGNASSDLPENSDDDQVRDVITIWLNQDPKSGEIISFNQKTIVAAVASQGTALPPGHRLSPADLFLPADFLSSPYILVSTLAALFSNASVALTTVAGSEVPIPLVARGVAPTVIAASSAQAFHLHDSTKQLVTSSGQKMALKAQTESLKSGVMPGNSLATQLSTPVTAAFGTDPGKLRLLYVFDNTNGESPPITSARLSDLRAFTGARVIHGLATPRVAGVLAQTNFYDYRREDADDVPGHFGVPPSCLEIHLVDKDEFKTSDEQRQGEILVRGPAVKDGEAKLDVLGEFREDGCLNYIFQYPERRSSKSKKRLSKAQVR